MDYCSLCDVKFNPDKKTPDFCPNCDSPLTENGSLIKKMLRLASEIKGYRDLGMMEKVNELKKEYNSIQSRVNPTAANELERK